jgi:hypothetical protein
MRALGCVIAAALALVVGIMVMAVLRRVGDQFSLMPLSL